jgi:phosphoribosylformylglycinamidine synthase
VDPASAAVDIQDVGRFDLEELRNAWEGTFPALFEGA